MKISGVGNKCGKIRGRCIAMRAPFDMPAQRKILLLEEADAAAVVVLSQILGVCVKEGGLTSHLAIICTELNLPFITLRGESAHKFAELEVILNSDEGSIEVVIDAG